MSIIALSPMDGITDPAFRYIVDTYSKPSLLYTEFVTVESVARGITRSLTTLIHHKSNTPLVAQLLGTTPDDFYNSTILALEMGSSGIDINMGCPDTIIRKRGAGSALMENRELVKKIIDTVSQAAFDWFNGKTLEETGYPASIIEFVNSIKNKLDLKPYRKIVPVSVKTRIFPEKKQTLDWISYLLNTGVHTIILHGRTVKEKYKGKANWEMIGDCVELAKGSEVSIYGNGDIQSYQEGVNKIKQYHCHGVLIGRLALGNPWIFNAEPISPTKKDRFEVMIKHCEAFLSFTHHLPFVTLRKHLAWYCKDFDGAARLRNELMKVNSIEDVKKVLKL